MANILFPVGRLIGGSVHKLQQQKDVKTKLPKIGTDGKPVENINFRIAIPKTMADWRQEPWGKQIHDIAKAGQPLCDQIKDFAFKIKNGDSTELNSKLKPLNTMVGYAGHWVVSFTQSWAPKMVTADGQAELPGERFVVGYYVQVYGDVKYNNSTESPGVYVNPVAVALAGEGEVLSVDVDTTAVGFGAGVVLPAGATAPAPASAAFAPAPASPAAPITVAPSATYMAAPAPAPRYVMTPKAGAYTKEQYLATPGWTEQMLIEQGYMTLG